MCSRGQKSLTLYRYRSPNLASNVLVHNNAERVVQFIQNYAPESFKQLTVVGVFKKDTTLTSFW